MIEKNGEVSVSSQHNTEKPAPGGSFYATWSGDFPGTVFATIRSLVGTRLTSLRFSVDAARNFATLLTQAADQAALQQEHTFMVYPVKGEPYEVKANRVLPVLEVANEG